ncbi:MAG: base excision DNA repair protein [Nitrospinae bacterium]|nr:base excision DNA repair protein [Nitrospinota bacterium]
MVGQTSTGGRSTDMVQNSRSPSILRKKLLRLADGLRERFGVPSRPRRANILDALVQTLLSQSTTDHNRNLAFNELKKQFPDWDAAAAATQGALARAVRSAGLGNQKAARVRSFLHWLRDEHGELSLEFLNEKSDTQAVELLTRHKGIGIKTAYVTLMWASDRDLFAVDVHIHRISGRLGLIGAKTTPEKAHSELGPFVPKGRAFELHVNMLAFGRTICKASSPKCRECDFRRMCPHYRELNRKNSNQVPEPKRTRDKLRQAPKN